MEIFKISKLYKTIVVNRPSKLIKSPYLADIIDPLDKSKIVLCHSPSLGMCGLILQDTKILVTQKNTEAKSKYSLDFVIIKEKKKNIVIGCNPNYANNIVKYMLQNNLITNLQNLDYIKGEYTIDDCRLDFYCKQNNKNIYIEVKNVPLADYYDCSKSDRKKLDSSNLNYDEKIAIFPDGYRKNSTAVVSERALKHIKTLTKLAKQKNNETYMIYITQREDVKSLTITLLDMIYRKAVIKAKESGVILLAYKIVWKLNKAYLHSQIPIIF